MAGPIQSWSTEARRRENRRASRSKSIGWTGITPLAAKLGVGRGTAVPDRRGGANQLEKRALQFFEFERPAFLG